MPADWPRAALPCPAWPRAPSSALTPMATLNPHGDRMVEWSADLRASCRQAIRLSIGGITGPHDPAALLQVIGQLADALMDIDQIAADMETVIRQNNGHVQRWNKP